MLKSSHVSSVCQELICWSNTPTLNLIVLVVRVSDNHFPIQLICSCLLLIDLLHNKPTNRDKSVELRDRGDSLLAQIYNRLRADDKVERINSSQLCLELNKSPSSLYFSMFLRSAAFVFGLSTIQADQKCLRPVN